MSPPSEAWRPTSSKNHPPARSRSALRVRGARLPFVFVNVATSADGKIAPSSRVFVPFGSRRDREQLFQLRAGADAVMAGARTVNSFPMKLGPGGKHFRRLRLKRGLAEYNLRVIVSGSGSINLRAEIFRHHFSPILILATERMTQRRRRALSSLGAEVRVCGRREIDFSEALRWLRTRWGVRRLLCEGGGELNEALLRAGLVDEIHVTLCPFIFGGRGSPTLADGKGVIGLGDATALEVKSIQRRGDELFLVYRVRKSSRLSKPRVSG